MHPHSPKKHLPEDSIHQEWSPSASTVEWLNERFRRKSDGYYYAHQPIYGFGSPHSEPGHIRRLARTVNILNILSHLNFETFLDVGAGEGYLSFLIQHLLGAKGVALEVSEEACHRAQEFFALPCVVGDAHNIPFADNSFDLVVASEVLEHVQMPEIVASELIRVARKYILFTTEEFCLKEDKQKFLLRLRDLEKPHTELNYFCLRDIEEMFGENLYLQSQFLSFLPRDEASMKISEAEVLIRRISKVNKLHQRGVGIIGLKVKGEPYTQFNKEESPKISQWLKTLILPIVESPYQSPNEKRIYWDDTLPRPVCRVEGCFNFGQSIGTCSHLALVDEALYRYTDNNQRESAVRDRPEWALKFEITNISVDEERRRLSKKYRWEQFASLLLTVDPWYYKLAWFLSRALKRLKRIQLNLKAY